MKSLTQNTKVTEYEVIKAKLLDSPLFFTRYFFKKTFNRKFVVNDHHKEIGRVMKRVFKGEINRVIINMPPRYGKTELLVKSFISMGLALNPRSKFIHTSYSETLALDNSESVKDLIESDDYQKFFNVKLKKDSKSKRKWYTDQGGGIYAAASGGQITGFGAGQVENESEAEQEFLNDVDQMQQKFKGAIIIDDPIKPEDADSPDMREKINQRFDNTIRSRVNSRNTPIIIVMQRVHERDLSGYLIDLEPDEWEVLMMPAISNEGKALWPFKHTIEELMKLKQVNELVFENQYQQDPKPQKGLVFLKTDFEYFQGNDFDERLIEGRIGAIDVADEGMDYLSFPIGHIIGSKIYITDWLFTRENTEYTIPTSTQLIKRNNLNFCAIETNNHGSLFFKDVKKNITSQTSLIPIFQTSNKHSRIIQKAHFIRTHFVFRSDYLPGSDYDKAMKQLFTYTKDGKAKHDDAPDSITLLACVADDFYKRNFE